MLSATSMCALSQDYVWYHRSRRKNIFVVRVNHENKKIHKILYFYRNNHYGEYIPAKVREVTYGNGYFNQYIFWQYCQPD